MKTKEKINIIIADDDPVFAEGLSLFLSKHEMLNVLEICSNGLDLVKSNKLSIANLLIVDVRMPVINGIEATKKIRTLHPDLPIFATSMYDQKVYITAICNAGFTSFISKDDITNSLLNSIKTFFNLDQL